MLTSLLMLTLCHCMLQANNYLTTAGISLSKPPGIILDLSYIVYVDID